MENTGELKKEQLAEVLTMDEAINMLYNRNYTVLGHGTNATISENILKNGFYLNQTINETTHPITPEAEMSLAEYKSYLRQNLEHWPFHELKHIVVLMIPKKPEEDKRPIHLYLNSIIEDVEPTPENGNIDQRVDKKYVSGYFDVSKELYYLNKDFHPEIPPIKPPHPIRVAQSEHRLKPIPQIINTEKPESEDIW